MFHNICIKHVLGTEHLALAAFNKASMRTLRLIGYDPSHDLVCLLRCLKPFPTSEIRPTWLVRLLHILKAGSDGVGHA